MIGNFKVGLVAGTAILFASLAHCQAITYPLGYLDSAGTIKMDGGVGATSQHLAVLDEIRAGKIKAALQHSNALVKKEVSDIFAWYLLTESSVAAKADLKMIFCNLADQWSIHEHKKQFALAQRFKLLLFHTSRLALVRKMGTGFTVNAWKKYLNQWSITEPQFYVLAARNIPAPIDKADAFLLVDSWAQSGEIQDRRKEYRTWIKRFKDYRFETILAWSLTWGSGGYLDVPAAPQDPREAREIMARVYRAHPEDALATYLYGMLFTDGKDRRGVAALERYLRMDDPRDFRKKKVSDRLAEIRKS